MQGTADTEARPLYLPNDWPPVAQLLLLGLQHVVTMFPATVLVGLLCGFHTSTVLLGAGLATISALALSRGSIGTFIPLFYGSSFSYIASYLGIAQALGYKIQFGVPVPDDVLSLFQAGIIASGILNVGVGFLVKGIGKARFDAFLPPVVTGSVACVIGFGLAKAALDMAFTNGHWEVALTTLLVTVGCAHLLRRGFLSQIPVLFGAAAGYLLTLFVAPDLVNLQAVTAAPMFAVPHLTVPSFSGPLFLTATFSIAVMAVATIPESTAHLYQMSLYVDERAERHGRPKSLLERYIGLNLVFDGVGDVVSGIFGAPAGTNYGENNALQVISGNYSGSSLMVAGGICVLLAFVGKLAAFVGTIPVFVSGGLAIYLFGAIGMQGIALMQKHHVNLFQPLQLAVGATIMVIGIGGNIGYEGGFLPIKIPGVFPNGLPAIATAAVVGIVLNSVLTAIKAPEVSQAATQVPLGPPTDDSLSPE